MEGDNAYSLFYTMDQPQFVHQVESGKMQDSYR